MYMNSVRDFRNNPQPIAFSELKRLINGIDEKRYGDSLVYVGEDNQCPVVGFSTSTFPPTALDAAAIRAYGLSDVVQAATHVHFVHSGGSS
jgi:hypothetical protein